MMRITQTAFDAQLGRHQQALLHRYPRVESLFLEGFDLSNLQLAGYDLDEAALFDCQALGVQWPSISLCHTDVRRVSFAGADLSQALVIKADWVGVNLHEARCHDLRAQRSSFLGCDFSHADCINAGFQGAHLSETILRGAVLRNVDFSRTGFHGAIFEATDLRGAHGFETAFIEVIEVLDADGQRMLSGEDGRAWLLAQAALPIREDTPQPRGGHGGEPPLSSCKEGR